MNEIFHDKRKKYAVLSNKITNFFEEKSIFQLLFFIFNLFLLPLQVGKISLESHG